MCVHVYMFQCPYISHFCIRNPQIKHNFNIEQKKIQNIHAKIKHFNNTQYETHIMNKKNYTFLCSV